MLRATRSLGGVTKRSFCVGRGRDRAKELREVGSRVGEFKVIGNKEFADLDLKLTALKHERLGTSYYHFDSEDTDNAFAFMFRTLPDDHTGKPHILEHTVLCGSERFPVRDPFMRMAKRSLNTFMNAMTGYDMTLYPFSTHNKRDFYNLLSVYADSVFAPKIDPLDFLQEGVRRELKGRKLELKGVVFNEMKGALEAQDDFVSYQTVHKLMQGSQYSFCFGGDPLHIPNLTHPELRRFYQKHYHPSNAVFMSYGDLDFSEHISFLEENYLKRFEPGTATEIPTLPEAIEQKGGLERVDSPAEAMETRRGSSSQLVLSYCLGEVPAFDIFGLKIIESMLLSFPSSPIYKKFISSERVNGYCAGSGLDATNLLYPVFTLGFRDVGNRRSSAEKLLKELQNEIRKVAEKGFSKELLDNTLHLIELSYKKGSRHFGVNLFGSLATSLNYSRLDLVDILLNVSSSIDKFRELAKQGYIQQLLKKYLVDNQRNVALHFVPDQKFVSTRERSLRKLLHSEESTLTAQKRSELKAQAKELRDRQEAELNVDCLPKLRLSDVPEDFPRPVVRSLEVAGVPYFFVDAPTKGVSYITLKLDISGFPEELNEYLNFLVEIFDDLGVKGVPYDKWDLKMLRVSSGIKMTHRAYGSPESTEKSRNILTFRINSLDRNIEEMSKLFSRNLAQIDFSDSKRLSSLLKMLGSDASSAIVSEALSFASSLAQEGVCLPPKILRSFKNAQFAASFAEKLNASEDPKPLIEEAAAKIAEAWKLCLKKDRLSVMVHSREANFDRLKNCVEKLITELSALPSFLEKEGLNQPLSLEIPIPKKEFFPIPSQINSVSESFPSPCYDDDEFPVLQIASRLLSVGPLLRIVRERQGAYGAGCSVSMNGCLTLSAFRSPQLLEVFQGFEEAVREIADSKFTDEDLEGAKLSFFSDVDKLPLPQEQGINHFIYEISSDRRAKLRKLARNATRDQIISVVKKYLLDPIERKTSSKVVFGNKETDVEELKKLGWTISSFSNNQPSENSNKSSN